MSTREATSHQRDNTKRIYEQESQRASKRTGLYGNRSIGKEVQPC